MITIYFESHATTYDNEAHIASGWFDDDLSDLGIEQAYELGKRYKGKSIDIIFCSDLQRSTKTAQIAFAGSIPVAVDARLRECNYGELTRRPMSEIDKLKSEYIDVPFPGGESFKDTYTRMKSFLVYLMDNYEDKTVMIIGHRATQYGLDELVRGFSIEEAVLAPWKWQPGWLYELSDIK